HSRTRVQGSNHSNSLAKDAQNACGSLSARSYTAGSVTHAVLRQVSEGGNRRSSLNSASISFIRAIVARRARPQSAVAARSRESRESYFTERPRRAGCPHFLRKMGTVPFFRC